MLAYSAQAKANRFPAYKLLQSIPPKIFYNHFIDPQFFYEGSKLLKQFINYNKQQSMFEAPIIFIISILQ